MELFDIALKWLSPEIRQIAIIVTLLQLPVGAVAKYFHHTFKNRIGDLKETIERDSEECKSNMSKLEEYLKDCNNERIELQRQYIKDLAMYKGHV